MKNQFEDELNKNNPVEDAPAENTPAEKTAGEEAPAQAPETQEAPKEDYYEHIRKVREEQNAPKKKNRKAEIILIVGALAVAAVLLLATRGFTEELKWQKVEGSAHQYYAGASSVINPGTELKVDDDGNIKIKDNDNAMVSDIPIYYDDRDALIITENYVYSDPRTDNDLQAEKLTEFYIKNGGVRAKKGKTDQRVEKGFLYNGKDKFIFLEPVTIEVNNLSIDVPALSYVEADPYGVVRIFNYETKETETIEATTEATASPEGKPYTVEMLSDSITGPDGIRMLLFFAPEKLDKLLS